jgi:hypothetical protein
MNTRTFVKLGLAGLLILAPGQAVFAQKAKSVETASKWDFLGEATVNGKADHDSIKVGGGAGMYRAIQLKVAGGPVHFEKVIVHYGNGNAEPIEVREKIGAGGKTRVIDLPGERRVIQSVEFFYGKADRASARPRVRLFGKH